MAEAPEVSMMESKEEVAGLADVVLMMEFKEEVARLADVVA